MFIEYQPTPNPDAMKFLPHARLALGEAAQFDRSTQPQAPLAERLLRIEDVARVLIGQDFVTVTRRPRGPKWPGLRAEVMSALAEHLASGAAPWASPTRGDFPAPPDGQDLENEIRQVVALYVRPGALLDGGDILIDRFDPKTGVLFIRMDGACNGCPSSQLTLKAGVEQIVRRFVPEVLRVEQSEPASSSPREPRWRRWFKDRPVATGGKRPIFLHNGQPAAPPEA